MTTMIERVARALQKADGEKPSVCAGVCTYSSDWRDYVDDAVTAIAAMREPTAGMWMHLGALGTTAYKNAIDAALEEEP
jgi:hypothetical protein